MLVHESKQIRSGQTGDGESEHWHFRNQRIKMDWNGWFNSDDHYICYCGQEFLRRNGVAIIVNKIVQNAVLGCNLKNDRMISVRFHGKPFNITVIQVYSLISNAEEAEMVLWRPTGLSRTNIQKRCPFHYRGLECKGRKSRDTWSNRHIWPWSTKRSRLTRLTRVLPRERTGHSKQEKSLHMDITRWSIPKSDWLYSLWVMDREAWHAAVYGVTKSWTRLSDWIKLKNGEALYSQEKQDQELTVAQIMNSLLPNSDVNWRT